MNRFTSLCFVAVVAIVGLSCGKEESVNNAQNTDKVKTYTVAETHAGGGGVTDTYNVNYDSQNRITSLVSSITPANRFEYTYNNDHYIMEIYGAGLLQIHAKFFLNSSRTLVDSCMQYNNTNDTSLTKYVFNSKQQLIQQREYDYSSTTGPVLYNTIKYTYNAEGLMIKEEDDDGALTYKYDKVFKRTAQFGQPYMPIPMQMPTQTIETVGPDTETTDYTYLYDNKNRLITETGTSDAGSMYMQAYTYF